MSWPEPLFSIHWGASAQHAQPELLAVLAINGVDQSDLAGSSTSEHFQLLLLHPSGILSLGWQSDVLVCLGDRCHVKDCLRGVVS